jgi:hypothetical protein
MPQTEGRPRGMRPATYPTCLSLPACGRMLCSQAFSAPRSCLDSSVRCRGERVQRSFSPARIPTALAQRGEAESTDLPVRDQAERSAGSTEHAPRPRGHAKQKRMRDESPVATGALDSRLSLHPHQWAPALPHLTRRRVILAALGAPPSITNLACRRAQLRVMSRHRR